MISAVIHTYNEEENIDRNLSSLTWVDEIILVDMGSRDKTLEIAGRYKTRIFAHTYTGYVEPARNFGIGKAKGDWILIIDADEELPWSLSKKIRQLENIPDQDITFYRIPRKNVVFGKWLKHSGWWPDHQIRFFRKGSVTWGDEIHRVPVTRGIGRELEDREELAIIHYHYSTIGMYLNRINRYSSIQAKELFLNNKKFTPDLLIFPPFNEFVKRFFFLEGYKDGLHGLAVSLLQAFSELIVYLKLWELSKFFQMPVLLDRVYRNNKTVGRIFNYWLYNELLKKPTGSLKSLKWRILRKLNS